ncbi:MAG: hypothetical protein LIP09_11255, partial [Bacteroidales bacterium]|nr:hypothetical protein [Bacteroidales bacterium]
FNNNNNKTNSNCIRAVAALSEEAKMGWVKAFYDCCKRKTGSKDCDAYRVNWEEDLWRLIGEVAAREYEPSPSLRFVVTYPKLREVYAAAFRDRIVHHWVCARLIPLLEERFRSHGNVTHGCRKGLGTRSAVSSLVADIEKVSQEYKREAWIAKFDLKGFFMSIDPEIVWSKLKPFIESRYQGEDKDTILYLTEICVKHRPQANCIAKSRKALFDALPEGKSMQGSRLGLPIGNLPSQLCANFILSFLDEKIAPMRGPDFGYQRLVDDFCIVSPDKRRILELRPQIAQWLKDLGLELHKDKFYLQECRKGVKFVGRVIKPGRTYLANRTAQRATLSLRRAARTSERVAKHPSIEAMKNLERAVASFNSYQGFLNGNASKRLRARILRHGSSLLLWAACWMYKGTLKIKRRYKTRNYLLTQEIKGNGLLLRKRRAKRGVMEAALRNEAAHGGLGHRRVRNRRTGNPLPPSMAAGDARAGNLELRRNRGGNNRRPIHQRRNDSDNQQLPARPDRRGNQGRIRPDAAMESKSQRDSPGSNGTRRMKV